MWCGFIPDKAHLQQHSVHKSSSQLVFFIWRILIASAPIRHQLLSCLIFKTLELVCFIISDIFKYDKRSLSCSKHYITLLKLTMFHNWLPFVTPCYIVLATIVPLSIITYDITSKSISMILCHLTGWGTIHLSDGQRTWQKYVIKLQEFGQTQGRYTIFYIRRLQYIAFKSSFYVSNCW